MSQGGSDAYQTLPYFSQAWHNPVVIVDWSTNAYHLPDLGLTFGCTAFTNHYHRGDGLTIDLGVGGHAVWVATWAVG